MKKPSLGPLVAHHRAFQQCFPGGPETYALTATPGIPGAQVVRNGHHYRVETLAEREQICREQLLRLEHALEVPYFVAERVLAGVDEHDEFYIQLVQVFYTEQAQEPKPPRQKGRAPSSALERKVNLALALGIQGQTGMPLWGVFSSVDYDLVAASLVAAGQLDTGAQLAEEMAEVYFEMGAAELVEVQGGYFAQVTSGTTELVVYQVDPAGAVA